MKISIVIPVYNEEGLIPLLRTRLCSALDPLAIPREIIFVSDGSTDRTAELIREWIAQDDSVILFELSRNFGHQAAISAGLAHSTGDAVVVMDADLQDPPEIIPEMIAKWKDGAQVVLAERRSRAESFLKKKVFACFYKVFEVLTDMPPTTGVFGLMDRRVVGHMVAMTEQNRYLPGLRHWLGFRRETVWYDRQPRAKGEPRQSLSKLLKYGLDAIFSFSYKPLRFSLILGFLISACCFFYAFVLIIKRILNVNFVLGFTTVAVAILFLGGVILMSIGIMGEYVGRIYDEVKKRPLFLIAQKYYRAPGNSQVVEEEFKNS